MFHYYVSSTAVFQKAYSISFEIVLTGKILKVCSISIMPNDISDLIPLLDTSGVCSYDYL
ncbi:hypothetical protein A0J61_04880 [Choanephora cucurbitarum]|uniref:Uncharacterized protein n=1 Tax=Choanephora cucurbitarum TaxID=101091 RepID=A0A1C7NDP0_9FUNG|nr:hypothetical protein A0J61_04880 [Choanephora cucurbitarum]